MSAPRLEFPLAAAAANHSYNEGHTRLNIQSDRERRLVITGRCDDGNAFFQSLGASGDECKSGLNHHFNWLLFSFTASLLHSTSDELYESVPFLCNWFSCLIFKAEKMINDFYYIFMPKWYYLVISLVGKTSLLFAICRTMWRHFAVLYYFLTP